MASPELIVAIILISAVVVYSMWDAGHTRHPFISKILIPILLLVVWFSLLIYQSFQIEQVFTLLTYEYSTRSLLTSHTGELYQGQKLVGKFTAPENNLGIVGVRFWTFYRLNSDYIIFRIKDLTQPSWYYENGYKSDQFQPNQYFTFGFPIITASKGHTYLFEAESMQGVPGDAVGMSTINPVFITKYKYSHNLLLSSPASLISFAWAKLINLVSQAQFTTSAFIFLLPLVLYMITLTPKYFKIRVAIQSKLALLGLDISKHFIFRLHSFFNDHRRDISVTLLIIGLSLDCLFIVLGDLATLLLVILWIYVTSVYKLTYNFFFKLALFSFGLSGVFYYLKLDLASEKFGAWFLLSMCFTLVLYQIEIHKTHG